jgi:membrane protein
MRDNGRVSEDSQDLRHRVSAAGTSFIGRARTRGSRTREARPWLNRIVSAYERYLRRSVGRQASVVTYVAYFLAFPLLVVYLIILEAVLTASPRATQALVSMLDVDQPADVANMVSSTSDSSFNAFLGFVGGIGVIIAAAATASNLRAGMDSIFGTSSPRRSLLVAPALDFSAGIWLAATLLASWVLALTSLARRRVATEVIGSQISWPAVATIKFGSVALALLVLSWSFAHFLHKVKPTISKRSRRYGAAAIAVFVVACNYVFLYFLVSTLVDPEGGGGFGLALVLLLWVSVVVRGAMFITCWVAVEDGVPDGPADG